MLFLGILSLTLCEYKCVWFKEVWEMRDLAKSNEGRVNRTCSPTAWVSDSVICMLPGYQEHLNASGPLLSMDLSKNTRVARPPKNACMTQCKDLSLGFKPEVFHFLVFCCVHVISSLSVLFPSSVTQGKGNVTASQAARKIK